MMKHAYAKLSPRVPVEKSVRDLLLGPDSEGWVVATATFQQGVNGYTGSSDTMLRQSKPTNNLGADSVVSVDGADSSGQPIQGLLRFDDIFGNGLGQIPSGAVITSATLTLNVTDGTSEPFSLYRMLTGWTEGSTWNSFGNGIQTKEPRPRRRPTSRSPAWPVVRGASTSRRACRPGRPAGRISAGPS